MGVERDEIHTLPEVDRTDEIYERALDLAFGKSRRNAVRMQVVGNVIYYGMLIVVIGWIFSMAIDREPPVKSISRDIVNENLQVRAGERIKIHRIALRTRSCELVRRYHIIDGAGVRSDYQPEPFDAYGPIGQEEETVGPILPIDVTPGRGKVGGTLAYDCNILQRALGWSIVVILPMLDFEILPRAGRP